MARIEEQVIQRRCQNDFYEFCKFMDPVFFAPNKPHLQEIAEALQAVEDKQIFKLAVSLPPRAGKSYIISLWCSWELGKHDDGSIMRNSYAADLAYTFSYDVRQIVQSYKYLQIFPNIKLKSDRKAIDDWALESSKRGAYFCAGVGGPITGKGCDLAGILDDPIKNIEEAMSETIIDKVWKWYTSTHLSRFETGCPEIHIATRWSRKDPIGMLTDEFSEAFNKDFTVIKIPALDRYGKSFCEAVKTTPEYEEIKRITDDFIWEAEFMQNPIESKGLLFPIEELKRFSLAEIKTKTPDAIIGHTDTADKGQDYLCSPIGKRFGEYTYITDVIFTQDGVELTEPLVAQQVVDTKCQLMQIESNNGGYQYSRNVAKLIKGRSYCSVITCNATTNKETRILMAAGYIKEYFLFRNDYEPGSDYDKFMRALTSYVKLGKNKHDDAPDAITGLANYMQTLVISAPVEVDPESPEGKFEQMLDDLGREIPQEFFRW